MTLIGHNHPSFDQVVEESLLRGLYLTQLNALSRCVRDPRMTARHAQVLATIIERTNVKTGMAYPGRAHLAKNVVYYVHGEAHHYSEASIAKTISELIDCGYIMVDRRAPEGGGRALSHYVTVAPSVEDLQAQISEWCRKVKGQPRREFPAGRAPDGDTGISVRNEAEGDTGISVRPPNGDTRVNVDARVNVTDGDTGVPADGDTGIPTVTGNNLPGRKRESASSEASSPGGDFAIFWEYFPEGRKRGRGKAEEAFRKIVAGKHKVGFATAAELILGAKRYAESKPDPEFVPLPTTWLNEARWLDDVGPPPKQEPWWSKPELVSQMTADRWREGINRFGADRWDVANLGPPPGHPQCVVPASIAAALRLTDLYTDKGIRRS